MAEESKIIEEVLAETDSNEQDNFDPTAFLGGSVEASHDLVDKPNTETPSKEVVTENATEVEEDGDFSWDNVDVKSEEVEEVAEPAAEEKPTEEETEDDWDSGEEPEKVDKAEPSEFNWEEIGKEAGIDASNKEEFIAKIKDALKPQVDDNDTIKNLSTFLDLTDLELVTADMRASKYDDDAIEDTVDRLKDSGLLKREATLIRQQLTKHIHGEKDRLRTEKAKEEKQKTDTALESKKQLQDFIKGKDEFFGGKVSQKEKKQLYGYITKGDFAQDIFESHANVAEAAFLWQNKNKIFKMIKTQGVEQGKSKVLDGITSPSRGNRSSNNFEAPKKGFDPSKFLG